MPHPFIRVLTLVAVGLPGLAPAADTALVRSEVAQIKKLLIAAEAALGVPAGYVRTAEDFNLPTEGPGSTGAGRWYPLSSSVRLRFEDKAVKEAESDLKKAGDEYQKKIAAATESGDYEEVSRLSVEYSARSTKNTATLMGGRKEPLEAQVSLNGGGSAQIDPDGVVLEKPGVIALQRASGGEGSGRIDVMLYLDPVALKDTKDAVSVAVSPPEAGLERKLGVYTINVRCEGPAAAVLAWVKSVNTGALLGIIRGETPVSPKPAK